MSVANALGRSQQTGRAYRAPDGSVVTRVLTWEGMASIRIGIERAL
ncbi:hypothetical protein ACHAC9_11335 [Massilia sp. CMS3.1]